MFVSFESSAIQLLSDLQQVLGQVQDFHFCDAVLPGCLLDFLSEMSLIALMRVRTCSVNFSANQSIAITSMITQCAGLPEKLLHS